jgi:hypothetical protein
MRKPRMVVVTITNTKKKDTGCTHMVALGTSRNFRMICIHKETGQTLRTVRRSAVSSGVVM